MPQKHKYIGGKYEPHFGFRPDHERKEDKQRYKKDIETYWERRGWKKNGNYNNHQKKQNSQTIKYNHNNFFKNQHTKNNNRNNYNDILNNYYMSRWDQFYEENALNAFWKAKDPNYKPIFSKSYKLVNKNKNIKSMNDKLFNEYLTRFENEKYTNFPF